MGLTEEQQDTIVSEYNLMLAQQRDVMARTRAMLAHAESLQPASPVTDSNTHGVRPDDNNLPELCYAAV